MGRPQRAADGGLVYHVLNRGNARLPIFESDADYEALERVLEQAVERYGTDLLAWCLMPKREFYEFILNNIPADIAVFSKEHKYVYINPQGIKNTELRKFMIGKDDFDYCRFKGIPDDMAHKRRGVFNSILENILKSKK